MPFTPSHVAAVLPLCGRAGTRRARLLVPAAMALGSMVPDLPYFVPSAVRPSWLDAGVTHAAVGPVGVDLLCGWLCWLVWRVLLADALRELAPDPVRRRLPVAVPLDVRTGLLAVPSVVLGAVTHVVWDSFTHADRWGTTHLAVLGSPLAGLPLFRWAQYLSGVVGLAVVVGWCLSRLRSTRPEHTRPARPARPGRAASGSWRVAVWVAAGAVLLASTGAVWALEAAVQQTWFNQRIVVAVVTRDITVVAALALGYGVAHTVRTAVISKGP